MRLSVAVAVACLSIVGLASADDVRAAIRKPTNIPAESLGAALQQLAKDRNFQVVYVSEEVNSLRTEGAVGEFNTEEALKQLLKGTGLTYRYLDEKTVTIVPASAPSGASGTAPAAPTGQTTGELQKEGQDSTAQRFLLAQAATGQASSAPPVEAQQKQKGVSEIPLQEIIVTAQKREERLIDVPQSLSVLSSDDIAKLGASQFRDWANTVPGLSFATSGSGLTRIVLQGVSAGDDISSTVVSYIDEVPYIPSTAFFGLDLGLFDLDRIEVLKGPQGTLYGASAMGGVIKYVSPTPNSQEFSALIRTGVSATDDGGVSALGSGVVNVPLIEDKLAVRAGAYISHDGGYIDNVELGQKDVNKSNTYGGKVDLLATPSDRLSIRVAGVAQNIDRRGIGTADYTLAGVPIDGSLDQQRAFEEPFNERFRVVSGTLKYDFGPVNLTSISSYQATRVTDVEDDSGRYVAVADCCGGPFSAVGVQDDVYTESFIQEVRLASQTGGRVEWLVGGFYNDTSGYYKEGFKLVDLAGQDVPDNIYADLIRSSYDEYAAFGNATVQLSEKLDITGGIRYAHLWEKSQTIGNSAFIQTAPPLYSSQNVPTYMANARYHLDEHNMLYFRYATGYRPGGANAVVVTPVGQTGNPTFSSDSLKNYEVGFKSESADKKVAADLSVFDIDWSNIQIRIRRSGGFAGILNAPGGATIRGAEINLSARPFERLTSNLALAYLDAHLNQANSDLGASAGERLPNVPRFTGTFNVDYVMDVEGLRPTVGSSVRYVSDRMASFDMSTSTPQYRLPDYTLVDLRAGIPISKVELQLYVHNIFDKRGQLSEEPVAFIGGRVSIVQPRTVGLMLSTKF